MQEENIQSQEAKPVQETEQSVDFSNFVVDDTPEPVQQTGKGGKSSGETSTKGEVETSVSVSKPDFGRFKEIDPEIDDEEKAIGKFKSLREENEKLKIAASGKSFIESDQTLNTYKSYMSLDNEKLAFASLYSDYVDAGLDEKTAQDKAQNKIKSMDEDRVEELALQSRKNLKSLIKDRESELYEKYETSVKSLDLNLGLDKGIVTKVKENLSKTDKFLSFKLTSDQKIREKMADEAANMISTGELQKRLKDPETLSKVAFFLKYEKQWEAQVAARNSGKAKVIEKLQSEPRKQFGAKTQSSSRAASSGFNPAHFLPKNKK